ncbi:MAG: bifunctional folylpolyglutamate synthase/dihydrofolate synthase, partial [Thermoleophilaceae bacterium]
AMLRAMAPLQPRLVFTRVEDPGALDPGHLLHAWRRVAPDGRPATSAASPREALGKAAEQVGGDQPIVVAGSLYLVGAVRGMITGDTEEG